MEHEGGGVVKRASAGLSATSRFRWTETSLIVSRVCFTNVSFAIRRCAYRSVRRCENPGARVQHAYFAWDLKESPNALRFR